MTVIDSYLDTLFAPYPPSPQMRRAREELRAMMEDKLQALQEQGLTESQAVGQVIAEFGTLDEVAPVLGIEREVAGGLGESAKQAGPPPPPPLSLERAGQYVDAVRSAQPLVAAAVPLFVLSPVPLIGLLGLTDSADGNAPALAVGAGLGLLLLIVAVGVILLVARGSRLGDFEDITSGDFTSSEQVRSYARELRREHRPKAKQSLAIAIGLWILSGLPTILGGLIGGSGGGQNSALPLFGVCLTLIMVAAGLAIMLRDSWSDSVAGTLLQERDEDDPEDSESPVIRVIAAVYWPVVVAAYLGWSFIGDAWGISWVIWPIAGVLYTALWAVDGALSGRRRPAGSTSSR